MQTPASQQEVATGASEPVEHVLEAANPIMGVATFLTLHLDPDWELAPGVGRPEVNASHERNQVRWVASGDFWYVVYNRRHGWTMELRGRVRPRRTPNLKQGSETSRVGGHMASIRWWTRRRGLPWRRHDVRYMSVEYECPHSDRSILLEFSGWCQEEGFRQILGSLSQLVCH